MRVRSLSLLLVVAGCAVEGCSVQDGSDTDASSSAQNAIPASEATFGEKRWVPLTSATPVAPEVTLVGDELVLRLGGYFVEEATLRGQSFVRVTLTSEMTLDVVGAPELPLVRANIPWSPSAAPSVEVLSDQTTDIASAPPLPTRTLTRDVDPLTVPYTFGSVYTSGATFPAARVTLGDAFDLRDAHGVPIQFQPFQYDAKTQALRVSSEMRLRVKGANTRSARPFGFDFEDVYAGAFSVAERAQALDDGSTYPEVADGGRLLIITADAYADAVAPLADWKIRRGLSTDVVKMSAIGATAQNVQSFIKSEFESPKSLTYVILVGDADTVPTLKGGYERADCDACYAMVKGTDFYPDLFISRVSGRSLDQIATQVRKFIAYERNPDPAGEWYAKGVGVASNEGNPTDKTRVEELRGPLLEYGYSSIAQHYDPGAKKADLIASVNAGVGLFNYMGHGSGVSWSTTGFSVADIPQIDNSGKWPFIIDVACQNGDFVRREPSLAEAWLRAGTPSDPKGAIAMYAASTNAAWVPPTIMQAWAVRELLVKEKRSTVGSLAFGGAARVLETGTGRTGQQLVEQYNIFGDASLQLRTKTPKVLEVTQAAVATGTTVHVTYADGSPVKGATAALSNGAVVAVALTDANGDAELTHSSTTDVALTVTGYNAVPFEGTVASRR